MKLLRDPGELLRLINQNKREDAWPVVSDAEKWLADSRNFALIEGDDLSLWMAQGDWPGPLAVHIFFASRGKKSREVAQRMLDHALSYGPTMITVKTTFRDVALFARRFGFHETHREGAAIFLQRIANPFAVKSVA